MWVDWSVFWARSIQYTSQHNKIFQDIFYYGISTLVKSFTWPISLRFKDLHVCNNFSSLFLRAAFSRCLIPCDVITPVILNCTLYDPFLYLDLSCRTTHTYIYICRTAPLTSRCCILYIIQQIYVQNILNMLHTLSFFSSKCRLFHNATFFGSCVIHILYTGCAKIKKKKSGVKS